MKKTLIALVSSVCLIVIVLLALPKYFCNQNKNLVQNALQQLQTSTHGQVTGQILSEDNGWFRSNSTIQLNYDFGQDNNLKGNYDIKLTTFYGPVLFTSKGPRLGQAYLKYELENNSQSAKYFSQPLAKGGTLIDFSNNSRNQYSGLQTLDNTRVQFDGFTAAVDINSDVTKISGKINFGTIRAVDPKNATNTFTIQPFSQLINLTRTNTKSLWTGTKNLQIPKVVIQHPDFNAEFNNITVNSNVDIDNALLNGAIAVTIPAFIINNQKGSENTNFIFSSLNATALSSFKKLLQNQPAGNASTAVQQVYINQLLQSLLQVFSGNSALQYNSTVNFTGSKAFVLKSGYANRGSLSNFNFSARFNNNANLIAGIDVSLDGFNKSAIGKLLAALINQGTLMAGSDPANPSSEQNAAAQSTMMNLLPTLVTANSRFNLNIVLPNDINSGFDLLDAKASFNQIPTNPTSQVLINSLVVNANWKIPTFTPDLINAFGPILIGKISDPQDQANASSVLQFIQQAVPLMIQQGYLQKQGDYYISNWNITDQSLLMNNKPIQPLIQQIQQQQQQQQQPAVSQPAASGATTK